ncbi:MAG: CBS domain-containing protein [Candidatus Aenigmatarchaeota archaeon]
MKVRDIMTTEPITISFDAFASEAISLIKENRVHELIVLRNNKLVGMVSPKSLIGRSVKSNERISNLMFVSPVLNPDDEINDIIETFVLSGCRDIPVVENEKLVGVVSEIDIATTIKSGKLAKDVMRPVKHTLKLDDHAAVAREEIIKHKINRLPVVGKEGKLKGMISTVDLLDLITPVKGQRKGDASGQRLSDVKVDSLMENKIFAVKPDDKISDVLKIIEEYKVSSVIVVEDGRPVGIITPKNILGLMVPPKTDSTNLVVMGLSNEAEKFVAENTARRSLERMARISNIISAVLDFKEHTKIEGGERASHELNARVKCSDGDFFATSAGWDIKKATKDVLERLETELKKKMEKKGVKPRAHNKQFNSRLSSRLI